MKRPEPFFRAPRGLWYVQLDGKQINLGPDKQAAWDRYDILMGERAKAPKATKKLTGEEPKVPLVISILEQYLDWLAHRVAEGGRASRARRSRSRFPRRGSSPRASRRRQA